MRGQEKSPTYIQYYASSSKASTVSTIAERFCTPGKEKIKQLVLFSATAMPQKKERSPTTSVITILWVDSTSSNYV